MSLIHTLFGGGLWHDLIWTLIHSLWLGLIVAGVVAGLLRTLTGQRPEARYAVALGGMAAVVLLSLVTLGVLAAGTQLGVGGQVTSQPVTPAGRIVAGNKSGERTVDRLSANVSSVQYKDTNTPERLAATQTPITDAAASIDWTAYAAVLWIIGAAVMLVRTVAEQAGARRLLRVPPLAPEHFLSRMAREIADRMHLRRQVRVAIIEQFGSPVVAGLIRPLVIFPAVIVTGLTPEQLKVVMAHELAHIRRHDMWVSLAQRLIESVLFFNPVVWWLSRHVRLEREACCDMAAAVATDGHLAVAQTLARAVESIHREKVAAVALANDKPGVLLQRVRRLVAPAEKIPVRLSWPVAMGILLTCAAVLAGLGAGAAATGQVAARWLTPQEHIEKIHHVRENYAPPSEKTHVSKQTNIIVKGHVRTEDGSALPKGIRLHSSDEYRSGGGVSTYSRDERMKPDGSFTVRGGGRITITARAQNYAPVASEVLTGKPNSTIEGIELVLSRGFSSRIRLVDDSGKPICNAVVKATTIRSGNCVDGQTHKSDADGMVTLTHLPTGTVEVETRAKGYQHDHQSLEFKPDKTMKWKLSVARAVRGTVLDVVTGKSASNAKIYLAYRKGFEQYRDFRMSPTSRVLLATTDAAGRFLINTLRDDSEYMFWVEMPGRGIQLVRDVSTRKAVLRVEFNPAVIHGRIVGDLSKLSVSNGKPTVSFHCPMVMLGNFGEGGMPRTVPVDVSGNVGTFTVLDIVPGDFWINVGDKEKSGLIKAGVNNIVIDLDDQKLRYQSRKVAIRLIPPEGWPVPSGKIRTDLCHPSSWRRGKIHIAEVSEGRATVDVLMSADGPGEMRCEIKDLPGYWFKPKTSIKVPHGEGPMILDIPILPAGSVYGTVLLPDGSPAENVQISLIIIKRVPNAMGYSSQWKRSSRSGRFVVDAVPLDGVYRICASDSRISSRGFVFSKEFTLDRSKPTREISLRLVEGVSVTAIITGPDGKPRAGAVVDLNSQYPGGGRSGPARKADRDGGIRWNHVNPDPRIKYSIRIEPSDNTQGVDLPIYLKQSPITVRLRKGIPAGGVVLDDATGRPVPGVDFILYIPYKMKSRYSGHIKVTTDAKGRFRLDNLEPIEYGIIGGQVASWVREPGYGVGPIKVKADKLDHTLRVKLRADGKLKPLPAKPPAPLAID